MYLVKNIQTCVKTNASKRSVVNDEKRCDVHVDEAPGLDQACSMGKRGMCVCVGGWGGGGDAGV